MLRALLLLRSTPCFAPFLPRSIRLLAGFLLLPFPIYFSHSVFYLDSSQGEARVRSFRLSVRVRRMYGGCGGSLLF
jgi:hypothetical protein